MKRIKYHVVIDYEGEAIIDITRKRNSVDEWVDTFQKKSVAGSSLKVYEIDNKAKTCSLVYSKNYAKPIGFGNW